jgi:hypothetical protein
LSLTILPSSGKQVLGRFGNAGAACAAATKAIWINVNDIIEVI